MYKITYFKGFQLPYSEIAATKKIESTLSYLNKENVLKM